MTWQCNFTWRTLLPAILLFGVSPFSHADILKQGFTATYEVYHNDMYLGDSVRTFKRLSSGDWQFQSKTEAKGMAKWFIRDQIEETSRLTQTDGNLRPLQYEYRQTGGKRNKQYQLEFAWSEQTLNNSHQQKQFPLAQGTQDLLSFQLQLMRELQRNKQEMTFNIADKKQIEQYQLNQTATETIETPMRSFSTVALTSNIVRKKNQFHIWAAPALQYLPVKIQKTEDDGDVTTLSLKSLQFN